MKNWLKISAIFSCFLLLVFVGCNNDDVDGPVPTLTLSDANLNDDLVYTADKGDNVTISVNISAPAGFNALRISYTGIARDSEEVLSTEDGQTTLEYNYLLEEISFEGAPFTITFQAVDDANQSTVTDVTVTPTPPSIAFPESENDNIVDDTLSVFALEEFILGIQVNAGAGFERYTAVLPDQNGNIIFQRERTELPPTQGNGFIDRIEESISAQYAGQILELEVTVDDEFGARADTILPVKVKEAGVRLYTAVVLEAPSADRSSKTFFASLTGQTFSVDEVADDIDNLSGLVDFGYFFETNAAFSSPNTYQSYDLGPNGDQWDPLNVTSFKSTILTPAEFDALTESQDLIDAYDDNAADRTNVITELTVDDIISFRTDNEKYGLIKVVRLVPGDNSSGEIEIEVRIN